MLKTRIIPCLDVKDGRVVKGVNFVDLTDAGDPVEQAKLYNQQGADELCFLDISATHEGRRTLYDMVERVASHCFMPLTVGGGVATLEDIRALLLAGADKVSINSAAVKRPEFVREAAEKFGRQCITVAIDARKSSFSPDRHPATSVASAQDPDPVQPLRGSQDDAEKTGEGESGACNDHYEIFTHGGRRQTGIDAIKWARKMVEYGAGEILLTSMDRDGTKQGYDIAMTRVIVDAVTVPVIASGGVGEPQHFVQGVQEAHASALLAASIFHFGEYSIGEVKQVLQHAGIAVRL